MAFAGSGNTVEISLMAVDNVTPVLRTASAAIGAFVGDADRMVNSLSRIGAAAAPILAIGAALYYAGQQASQVQQNVANLNSVLHGTSDQLAAIRQNGLALSQATQFTDAQILQAQRQLAKGGSSAADLAQFGSQGVTGATLNLASSTQTDPTRAATAMVTASKAFGVGNEDAARTATLLAQAVDTSVGTLESQATALRQVGVVARAAGMDMKDTVTTIAALQNQGLGTTTGTALTTFMLRLEAPTQAAKQAIADLNLQFYNLNGTLKGTPEIFDEIRAKTVGLTDEAANADLEKIFGLRGIRVADIAKEQGGGILIEQAQQMAEMGSASDIAARKLDTFQGSASKALSSLNVLAVQMGQTVVPVMKGAADDILSVANALSSINNVVPVIPQIAIAAGALGVASKISGGISDSRNDAATKAAADARKVNEARIAGASEYSNAIAQAEFAADSKIIAADQALAKQQQALNNQVYEQYVANEEKTVAAMVAADDKRIASLQAVTDKTLTSIQEIDLAYAASASKQIDMQALTFQKEQAMLSERQQSKVNVGAIRAVGTDPAATQQAIFAEEQASLARQQAIRAEYLQKDIDLQQRSVYAKRDATVEAAAQQVQAIEAATQAQIAAIVKGSEQVSLAQAEAAAKESAAMTARATEEKAAAERVYLSQVGTSGLGPGVGAGSQAVEGSIIAGMGKGGTTVPVNTKLVAGQVAVDEAGFIAGAKSAFSNGMSKIVGGIGQLILPLTVVMLAKEFVINPIEQAVIDRAAKNDPELNQIKVNTKLVIDNPASNQQDARKAIDDQAQTVKDELQKKQNELAQEQGGGTENIPVLSHFLGDSASIAAKKEQIKELQQLQSDLAKGGSQVDLIPAATMSKASDEISTIMQRMKDGTITQAQAEAQWKSWGAAVDETTNQVKSHDDYLKSLGLTTEQIISLNKQFIDSEDQVARAVKQAAEDAFATYRENARQAVQASQLGVPDEVATGAYFGRHTDQSPISKAQQELDVKIVKQYSDAWKSVQEAVNGVDLSKGINGLSEMRRKLDDAVTGLAALGIANPALQGIADIADSFAQVTDAENHAEQAMQGYNLTLTKTNEYMGKLGQVQKDFDQALLAAQYAHAAGTATDAQEKLIANRSTIGRTILGQQQQISANLALDVLGEVEHLADFKALDDYMRDIVAKAGGGLNIVATITTNLLDVKNQLDLILKDRTMDVTINPVFSQFDTSIADRAKAYSNYYGNMGGNSPYDQPGQPPQGPPGGTGPGLPPGTGVGVSGATLNGQSPLSYRPISYQDYVSTIRKANIDSPLQTTTAYNQFVGAAEETNVDPRLMMMRIMMESQYGATASRELQGKNNYAGITNGQGQYQSFGSLQDFFKSLGSNLSTGIYQQPFQQGDLQTVLKDYVVGPNGVASSDQQANISNSIAYYNRLRAQTGYGDASGGGKGAYGYTPDQAAASEHLTTQQNLQQSGDITDQASQAFSSSNGGTNAIFQAAQQHLNQQKDNFGRDVYGWCLEIVDDIMKQAGFDERGQHPDFSGNADQRVRAAENGLPGAGRVIPRDQARPGDIVGWEASPQASAQGHIGIYAGNNQYIGTTQNGVQTRDLFDIGNAVFIRPDGVVANGPEPGTRAVKTTSSQRSAPGYGPGTYNSTGGYPGTVDATDPNNPYANPNPQYIYPSNALPALGSYGRQMGSLDARGQGEMQQFFDRLMPVFTSMATGQKGFGPTGEFGKYGIKPNEADKQEIDNLALQENLTLTTNIGKAIQNINSGLAVTPAMYDAIRASAGPLGDLVVAQVQATAQLEEHTNKLAQLKKDQQDADLAYQDQQQKWQRSNEMDQRSQTALQWTRQAIDEQTQDDRTRQQRKEQDADTLRQRNKTLDDRVIQDARQKQQWGWQDEAEAIQNSNRLKQEGQRLQDVADTTHKESLDDAFETQSRAFQDQQRLLEFRGGQDSIALQDARKQMDEQHRLTTENAQQTGGLFVSLGKGSQTEAQANAFASQAAAIDDARKKADDLYRKQGDANTRAQDALSKQHAQQMFDLETETLAQQRKHEDDIKGIDRAAESRHNAFTVTMFDIETTSIATQKSHEMIQRNQTIEDQNRARSFEDESFRISQLTLAEQRRWQDADERTKKDRESQDQTYQKNKWQEQDIQQDITNNYNTNKKLNADHQADEQKNISDLDKQISGIDLVISKYDTLLKMFGSAADQALNNPKGSGGATTSVPGFASGTPSSPAGYANVNEQGGELRFLASGETILPADQTRRLMSAVLGYNGANNQQGAAQTINGGNVVINLNDEELRVSSATADKIRALVREAIQDNATESPNDSWSARGGMRR